MTRLLLDPPVCEYSVHILFPYTIITSSVILTVLSESASVRCALREFPSAETDMSNWIGLLLRYSLSGHLLQWLVLADLSSVGCSHQWYLYSTLGVY